MPKKSSKGLKKKSVFVTSDLILFLLIFAIVGAITLYISFAAPRTGSSCAITPSTVTLDQNWTVTATGLPTKNVNQIISFPDGAQSTGPITVNSNGTFVTNGNSNMSATWGFIAPEQTGTYNYKYVGKIRWPGGSFNTTYASCNVVVQG
jgi:hypothetical protein